MEDTYPTPGNFVFLERDRVDRLLEKAVQKPIVSIVAGAGYGKTNAVLSFVKKFQFRTAWIQCSGQENNKKNFWKNYVSAISVINRAAAGRLKQMEFPVTEAQFKKYLEVFKKEEMPNEKYILVYDDVHLIQDKELMLFLERTITTAFPNISSVLLSRTDLVFTSEKTLSKKPVSRITGDELRFSRDEMISFFKLLKINPGPRTASAIYHETEGWAFAVYLAGLALKNEITGAESKVMQALRFNTFRYIEEEIMASLAPDLRRFLIKISLLENYNRDLLLKITGEPDLVKKTEGVNSFINYDSSENLYGMHRLFREYLASRQNELDEDEKKVVWETAASWSAANNRKTDTVTFLEKAKNLLNPKYWKIY